MKRLFSAIQPNGCIHLGNYIGAIKQWIKYENEYESIFCIVDLHALTTIYTSNTKLLNYIMSTVALYLACGIDPLKTKVFIQSNARYHTDLAWILGCSTPIGWLNRMTQYKSKSEKKYASSGLINYPILMASDILLYNSDLVPVGDDQRQHIEFTKSIATKFNNKFRHVFKIPNSLVSNVGARVMGLNNPENKMSKSSAYQKHHMINLLDSPHKITSSVMSAVTGNIDNEDTHDLPSGIKNLCSILMSLSNLTLEYIKRDILIRGYIYLKKVVISVILKTVVPIQSKYKKIVKNKNYIKDILTVSEKEVNNISEQSIKIIKNALR